MSRGASKERTGRPREGREDGPAVMEIDRGDQPTLGADPSLLSDTMRVLRVQLEFRHPGLLFSAAPDPHRVEAERAARGEGRARGGGRPERLSVADQARRARYLVPGSEAALALPARNLLGCLKGAAYNFRAARGEMRTTARIAAGAAILPSMIPIVSPNGSGWVPRTTYEDFVRQVPIPGRKGGSVPCGRALVRPPCRTAVFELCLSTTLFAPWEDAPRRSSEALSGRALIEALIRHGGETVGLCAWRPSAPFSPGPFGKFHLVLLEDTGEVRGVDEVWQAAFAVGEQGAI